MNKTIKIILIILIVIVVWFAIRFIIGGPEDDWLCVDGEWVKHGMPAEPMPMTGCGQAEINNFFECLEAGYPAMESYPRQCRDGEGNLFVEDIGNELEKIDLIRIDSPRPNQTLSSPLIIQGQARGYWFFEADFPIKLLDGDDNILVEGYAAAEGEWMTEDFVPFKAALDFVKPGTSRGSLILERNNPSGLPENNDQLRIPINF